MSETETAELITFRFMSHNEFRLYQAGALIEGRPQYALFSGNRGEAVVCFLPVDGGVADAPEEAELALEYLSGIVSRDICAVFRSKTSGHERRRSQYADPYGSFFDTISVEEICCQSYSKATHILMAYCAPPDFMSEKNWDWKAT